MKFSVITFGCKVNSYESEYMKEQLIKNGYVWEEDYTKAGIVIVNTCSVTNTADNKSKKMIRAVKRENPKCILMVCGCTAENKREELNDLDIDILIGNKEKSRVVDLIESFLNKGEKYIKFYDDRRLEFEDMCIKDFNLTRAFVKIQDGCNNYCAYCIIPYVRGTIRSKKMEDVLKEVKELVGAGHKEIVLTGINTGAYGKEIGNYDLTDLINELSKIDGLERIRVSSIEMTEINDKFIQELKNNKKLCGHLHVSLQSGSEHVLKMMNRKYDKEEYYNYILKIREARPDINLTTDVIVGFPGETEEDFKESIEFCKKVGFSKIHVFPYSVREGTKAAAMPNQLSNDIKKKRARELIEIDNDLQLQYNQKYVGKTIRFLVEEIVDGNSIGHTENFLKVVVPEILEENKEYDVLVKKAEIDDVICQKINK